MRAPSHDSCTLTKWAGVQLGNLADALVISGGICLVADEGVKQRFVRGCNAVALALEARLHAIVQHCEEVAIVNAVADGDVVLQGDLLVIGSGRRLSRGRALLGVSALQTRMGELRRARQERHHVAGEGREPF